MKSPNELGDVAHMVERSLCMREVRARLAARSLGNASTAAFHLLGRSVLFSFPLECCCSWSRRACSSSHFGAPTRWLPPTSLVARSLFLFYFFESELAWSESSRDEVRASFGTSTSLVRRQLVPGRHSCPTMQPSDKLFQGALLQKYFFCSATTADDAHVGRDEEKDKISVTFVDKNGEEQQIKVPIGMSMLEAAHANDIELEGACEGSLACSTCHVIVMDMDYYNKLEDPADEENDMLDLAFGLTETSRLGCQVIARPELDGIRLAIPAATRNFAVDGFVPKPH
ncbi:2Fe-2S ferredoxin-type domain-containing protein [Psidium guajava]|nr:2Fe-2S ferredoxin-type domain-containing protein [Psidium guajava]